MKDLERNARLRASRLYDGNGGPTIPDAHIEVVDGLIRSITSGPPAGADSSDWTDYGDATILPGMIDTHCHITLTGDGKTYEEQCRDPDEMMALIAVSNMSKHLASGVTTVRDNGGRNQVVFIVREAIQRGYVTGPRLLLAGRPVTHSMGHFHWCGGAADGLEQVRAAVRRLVAEGADHIKIMASGGGTAGNVPFYSSYTVEEMRVAVETAHGLGRRTTAHARAASSIEDAVEAGLDCIEHAEFLIPAPMTHHGHGLGATGEMRYDPKVGARMKEEGTYVSFTAQAGGYELFLGLQQKARTEQLSHDEHHQLQEFARYFAMKQEVLQGLLRDGLKPRLSISSDAGPFAESFGCLQHGLVLAVAAGMTATEALDAVTRIPSELIGIEAEVGTLTPGKRADLLVVGGDPTVRIEDMWDVRAVFQEGVRRFPHTAEAGAHRAGS